MGTRLLIPSVAKPNIRYVIYESWSDNPTNGKGFHDKVTAFDTYGDGNVQHCHEWSVQPDDFRDFLESLMLYLGDHSSDEWFPVMGGCGMWPDRQGASSTDRKVLAFASSPLYKDDKHSFNRTYNLRECKVSTAEGKRHDKRWESVQSWMDGSFAAFMGLTVQYRPQGLLGLYAWAEFAFENHESYGPYDFRLWMKMDSEVHRQIRDVFTTIDAVIVAERESRRSKSWLESRCESFRERMADKAELVTA